MSTLGKLRYLRSSDRWDEVKPYEIKGKVRPGQQRNNVDLEEKALQVKDARALGVAPSLETFGFEWIHHSSDEFFSNRESIDRYLSEMEDFLRCKLKADFVYIQEYRLRKRILDPTTPQYRPVSSWVHIDITPDGAEERVWRECLDHAESILNGTRYRFVSVWRSLFSPLEDYPIAVCDSRTVDARDLVAMNAVYPSCVVEMYAVKHSEKHEWYFLPHQRFDEVLAITKFDSKDNKCVPHSGFELQERKPGTRPCESIEIRALVAEGCLQD